jgi:hypothetical protein
VFSRTSQIVFNCLYMAVYDQPAYRPSSQYGPMFQGRPGSTMGGPQPFGWGPNYDQHQSPAQQPTPQPGYSGYPGPGGPAPAFPVGPQSQPLPSTTPAPGQLSTGAGYGSIPGKDLLPNRDLHHNKDRSLYHNRPNLR